MHTVPDGVVLGPVVLWAHFCAHYLLSSSVTERYLLEGAIPK
jgi:hypothetical protein